MNRQIFDRFRCNKHAYDFVEIWKLLAFSSATCSRDIFWFRKSITDIYKQVMVTYISININFFNYKKCISGITVNGIKLERFIQIIWYKVDESLNRFQNNNKKYAIKSTVTLMRVPHGHLESNTQGRIVDRSCS